MKDWVIDNLILIVIILLIYVGIALSAWGLRNPTANQYQVWIHPISVLTFEKLDKFQGK